MKCILAFSCALLMVVLSHAQPTARTFNGCHHTHNKSRIKRALTERELQLMNESIARSDTFDILNYTIHLDVTSYSSYSIKASTEIRFVARMNNLQSIQFDLMDLTVDSVSWGETPSI
ncbi:MAG: hypothetical protein ACKOSR_06575, partial [Flavobacteriales bacterium]